MAQVRHDPPEKRPVSPAVAARLPEHPSLPREVALEIDNFEAEVARFVSGELSPGRFRAFRLAHGVYGQRQPGVQMVRVKIPTGALTGAQMRRLADIGEAFSPTGLLHLTTRQDVQYHYVELGRVPHMLRLLAEIGLTSREACGNSVRNVTSCPVSGFIADVAASIRLRGDSTPTSSPPPTTSVAATFFVASRFAMVSSDSSGAMVYPLEESVTPSARAPRQSARTSPCSRDWRPRRG